MNHSNLRFLVLLFLKILEKQGFKSCYLETTKELWQAVKLYEKLGFKHLTAPKGNTGHSYACEIWMEKQI